MEALTDKQKQLIFDYCSGFADDFEAMQARRLLDSSPEALALSDQLNRQLQIFSAVSSDKCPDDLVQKTLLKLKQSSHTINNTDSRLNQLLVDQIRMSAKADSSASGTMRHILQISSIAASVLIIAMLFMPSLRLARQKSWQIACQRQLGRVFQGISDYSYDNDGKLPAVAAGNPWWQLGNQNPDENKSNTKNMWKLVRQSYVNPSDFICPGRRQGRAVKLSDMQLHKYNDFPSRKYITYSYGVISEDVSNCDIPGRRVLMADLNPLFEKLPENYSVPFKLIMNDSMRLANSHNHNRTGQNILFSDGSVGFKRTRRVGLVEDDIFTLHDRDVYEGIETPDCSSDVFVAP